MTYRVLYTEEAARRIGKLDKTVKDRVGKAISRLSEILNSGNVSQAC